MADMSVHVSIFNHHTSVPIPDEAAGVRASLTPQVYALTLIQVHSPPPRGFFGVGARRLGRPRRVLPQPRLATVPTSHLVVSYPSP